MVKKSDGWRKRKRMDGWWVEGGMADSDVMEGGGSLKRNEERKGGGMGFERREGRGEVGD